MVTPTSKPAALHAAKAAEKAGMREGEGPTTSSTCEREVSEHASSAGRGSEWRDGAAVGVSATRVGASAHRT